MLILYRKQISNEKRELVRTVCRAWEKRGYQTAELPIDEERASESYLSEVRKQNPEYLVTIDMVGFGWTTLLEGSVYNLLHAKQLHLLTGDCGQYDTFLRKEYAINLFFFSDSMETVKNREKEYPLLPHLEWMPGPEGVDDAVGKLLEHTKTAGF